MNSKHLTYRMEQKSVKKFETYMRKKTCFYIVTSKNQYNIKLKRLKSKKVH